MSGASLRWTAESGRPHVSIVIPDAAGCGLPPLRGWAHFTLEAAHERSFAPLDGRGRPSLREYRYSGRRGLWSAGPFAAGLTLFSRQRMSGASLRWTAEGGRPHVSIVIPDAAGRGLPPLRGWAHFTLEAAHERSFAPLDGRERPSPREYRYSGRRNRPGAWFVPESMSPRKSLPGDPPG